MGPSETCSITDTKLKKIAWLSARDANKKFDCLMHHFNEESLAGCFHELDGRKAVGIDGIDKEDYGRELEANLEDLVARMKRMAYRPRPVRQVLIDKEDKPGEKRPLCISNFEDKIVQRMVHKVLASIYEPLFLDCSYGFRQGLGCHDAIQALWRYLYRWEVQTILDIDLARFFDTIDKQLLLGMLSEKIKDQRFLRYLVRMFKSGVLAEGELRVSEEGVPQGSICSPILANIFAHYVIDTWFEETVRPHCAGRVALFRYADDAVVCCQYAWDAERIRAAFAERLAKYHLALNEEKTKLIPFHKRAQREDGRATFDFLGFTFYWGQSRNGVVIPKVKTIGKRFRQKLRRVNDWARVMRHRYRLPELWARFCAKLQGHIQYYGVTFNLGMVRAFVFRATQYLFKWLNRRSQRQSFSWARFLLYIKAHPLPAVRAYHSLCTFQ
jgi:RNA-directed DNA polymerase